MEPTGLTLAFVIVSALLFSDGAVLADTDWEPVMAAICEVTNAPVTTKGLGALCKVANDLPASEESVRQNIFKIACAGLLSIGDSSNFEKLYARITDKNSGFEYIEKCRNCDGTGRKEMRCQSCGGSGSCPACNGQGGTRRRGLAGAGSVVMPCGKCGRTGKCDRCKGRGRISEKCISCGGKGKSISVDHANQVFHRLASDVFSSLEDRTMAAKGLYRYGGEWVTLEELNRRKEMARKEQEEREARRRELIERMRDLGLEYIDGEWMTPGSLRNVKYQVFQIYRPGHALCQFTNSGIIFCLLFKANLNRNVAEGDYYRNDLYRCGTYSYTTVQGAPSTVRMYAIDLDDALEEIERQQ